MERMTPNSCYEIGQLKALIIEGRQLLTVPEINVFNASSSSDLAVPINIHLDKWVEKSLTLLYSLLPQAIINTDFRNLTEISKKNIVHVPAKKRLFSLITSLEKCLAYLSWLLTFNEESLNLCQRAKLNFESLDAIVKYSQENLAPLLLGLEDGRTKKTAMLHLYGRLYQLSLSVVKLNDLSCCQLLVASLRSMLELFLDIVLINDNIIGNCVEKFFTFEMAHRLRTAKILIAIDEELKKPAKESSVLRKYLEDSESKEEIIKSLWKKIPKNHWTDLPVEKRARIANQLELYRHIYYNANMYVHSGYVSFPKTEDEAHSLCSYVYAFSMQMIKEASEITCEVANLADKDEIKQEIERIYLLYCYFQVWKSEVQIQQEK